MTMPEVRGALPNLLIVGVTKGGTTSLFRYLGQHPDICPSTLKEARYFTRLSYGEPLPPISDYSQLFRHCAGESYRMEATPNYYPGGRMVAQAITRLLPDSRVIVSFRDPVQRCWSYYRFVRSTARIPRELGFPAYLDRCAELDGEAAAKLPRRHPFGGLQVGCYDRWIDDWLDVFGPRLRVEFFEDLTVRPQEVVAGLCRWLSVDADVCGRFEYHVENRTVQYRNRRLQEMALALNRGGERFFGRHPALKRALRGAYYRFNADMEDESLDPDSRERLIDFYAPHNQRLATRLRTAGCDGFPAWLAGTGGRDGSTKPR
jgi:hypothetical protein